MTPIYDFRGRLRTPPTQPHCPEVPKTCRDCGLDYVGGRNTKRCRPCQAAAAQRSEVRKAARRRKTA